MIKYSVSGPYLVPKQKGKALIDATAEGRDKFWDSVAIFDSGIANGCGCYVLSVRNVVWYVGLAQKQSFRRELFSPDKINKMNQAAAEGKGDVYVHFLSRLTPQKKYTKPSKWGYKDIEFAELFLISIAVERNEDLLNKKDTKFLRELLIPGFLNNPKGVAKAKVVQSLKKVING